MRRKKIISILIKLLIGLGSFIIIYLRLKSDFTADKVALLYSAVVSGRGLLCLGLCLILIPVNWGIETYKWQVITRPIEKISFINATRSVYSGVCLGNLAPGRATEFVAKILFFLPENRTKVTVLHFMNGMFQLSVTVIAGLLALLFKFNRFGSEYSWMLYVTATAGIIMLVLLVICIIKVDAVISFVSKKLSRQKNIPVFKYSFGTPLLVRLFLFSVLRYAVFFSQFILLIYLFHPVGLNASLLVGIAIYFLITTVIPMISVLEAAIRAAVALVVFSESGIGNSALALSSVMIWLVNIIIPSLLGYYFLLQENFNFNIFSSKK